jgi:hypothetical protein
MPKGLGTMSRNTDSGGGTPEKPGNSSERLDNPPLWSPWNFQNKQRDWHEDFYGETHSSALRSLEK